MIEAFFGLWLGLIVAIIAWGVTNNNWKSEAVDRELASYCPTDGRWAWNGECEK